MVTYKDTRGYVARGASSRTIPPCQPSATAQMISRDLVLATTALAGAGGDLDVGNVGEVQGPEEVLGLSINLDDVHVQSRHVRHEVHAALALLLLQLQGDAADGAAGD